MTTEIVRGAIDCDVHVQPPSMDALRKYFSPYWLEYIRGGNIQLTPGAGGYAYPINGPVSARPEARAAGVQPPRDYESLKAQLLDPYDPALVILNCTSFFYTGHNVYWQAAVTTALNEWLRDEWLDKDDRLRASICVPTLDPEAAAEEIDRLAGDRRFVQIILPVRSDTPWGHKRWRALHAAASRHDLPIALHAWGAFGTSPTTMGFSHTYFEDYLGNSRMVAPVQLASLVTEGVFEVFPNLRICLSEVGFTWIPSLMWALDKEWKSLWRETPWLKMLPSQYVRKHFRATTTPAEMPPGTSTKEIAQLAHFFGAWDFLMYSSDYPHDHGEDGTDLILDVIGEEGRAQVLRTNAESFYNLAAKIA